MIIYKYLIITDTLITIPRKSNQIIFYVFPNSSFFQFQSKLREAERQTNLENLHNEELMLELALNKSKEKGSGLGNAALIQQATNLEDYLPATMAPPPTCISYTYSNAIPTTLTTDITSLKKGKQIAATEYVGLLLCSK